MILVIDPATRSLGWSLWKNSKLFKSGTIKVDGNIGKRLWEIYKQLREIKKNNKIDVVFTERMNKMTNYRVNFAIGVIFLVFYDVQVYDNISPSAWKKYNGLKNRDKGLTVKRIYDKLYPKHQVESDDEIEAILMGRYVCATKSFKNLGLKL